MADPTEAEVQADISRVVASFIAWRDFGSVNSPNVVSLIDDVEQGIEGDYAANVLQAGTAIKSGTGGVIQQHRALLDPLWLTLGKVKNYPETTPEPIIARYYEDFVDGSDSVNSREFTFGSVTQGGSNIGNGTINRLTVDENNFEIENATPDTKTMECTRDEHTGSDEHEEAFEIHGQHADRHGIVVSGSGRVDEIRGKSARTSQDFLENPSFDTLDGTVGSPTTIPGWDVTTIGNFELDPANYYRDHSGGGTPRALKLTADDGVSQNLNNTNVDINPGVPMYLQFAWNRSIGASDACTLTLTLGSQTEAIAVAGDEWGWQIGRLAIGQKNWHKTWNKEDPTVAIDLTGLASGSILIDDVVFVPYDFFDGLWYAAVGGSTPWLRKDKFTVGDSIASDAKLQRAFAELYGMYLPHVDDASETWSDPA